MSRLTCLLAFLTAFTAGAIRVANGTLEDAVAWDNDASAFYSNLTCLDDMYCSKEDCLSAKPSISAYYTKRCSCHSSCLKYGLCCINFEEQCMTATGDDEVSFRYDGQLFETRLNEQIVTCERYDGMYRFTISKCRRPLAAGVDVTEVELCEGGLGKSLTQIYPVSVNNDLYKNIHCAKCNGVGLVDTKFVEVIIECSVEYMRRHSKDDAFQEADNIFNAIRDGECEVDYNDLLYAPPCAEELVSTCDDMYKTVLEDYTELTRACQSYTAYLTHPWTNGSVLLFQNYHCALCNGMADNVTCTGSYESMYEIIIRVPTVNVPSLMVLLDFSGSTSQATVVLASSRECQFGKQMLDVIANECIDIPCPDGYMLYDSSFCILNNSMSFKKLLPTSNDEWYEDEVCIFYNANFDVPPVPIPIEIIFDFVKSFIEEDAHRANKNFEIIMTMGNSEECLEKKPQENALKFVARVKEPKIAMYMWASNVLSDAWTASDLTMQITRVVIQTASHSSLVEFTPVELDQVLYVSSQSLYIQEAEVGMMEYAQEYLEIFIPTYGITVNVDQIQLTTTVINNGNGTWTKSVVGVVVPTTFFNCSHQFQNFSGDIELCTNSSLPSLAVWWNADPETTGEAYEAILTITFSTVSIVALCASLVAHFIVPSPLSLPTKILISLLLSLLVAHVLFLVSALKVWPEIVCSLIAATQHFSWLASFAWMNVLSCNLYINFRSVHSQMSSNNSYGQYSLYGWLVPAFIVGLCAVLLPFDHFRYGTEGSCWIVGGLQLAIAFALPMFLMITTNGVFFILLIRSLRASMREASLASNVYDTKYRLKIHTKLFSVMGSTWILGFLSNVPQLRSLSYPFVVLTCLNGLFVSMCFTLNQRFFKLFKDRISTYLSGTTRTQN